MGLDDAVRDALDLQSTADLGSSVNFMLGTIHEPTSSFRYASIHDADQVR